MCTIVWKTFRWCVRLYEKLFRCWISSGVKHYCESLVHERMVTVQTAWQISWYSNLNKSCCFYYARVCFRFSRTRVPSQRRCEESRFLPRFTILAFSLKPTLSNEAALRRSGREATHLARFSSMLAFLHRNTADNRNQTGPIFSVQCNDFWGI
jgi:hypothetical protein